jgi:flagellar motility protein MotE (MotC chaperone)
MAEKRLTREQARELYDDLHKAMTQMMTKNGQAGKIPKFTDGPTGSPEAQSKAAKEIAAAIRSGLNGKATAAAAYSAQTPGTTRPVRSPSASGIKRAVSQRAVSPRVPKSGGQMVAMVAVVAACALKVTLSALEATGVSEVKPVEAAVPMVRHAGPDWSKEEVKVLTALDHRRTELEERSSRLDQKEVEITARDRDVAVKLNELKELTDKLKIEREKGDKHRNSQLDQLANVYGSMNPPEAAHLLEQLDIQVALSLIQRMPEKRMAQILALMNAQRALELTNLLSQSALR